MSDFPNRPPRLASFSSFDIDALGVEAFNREGTAMTSNAWPVANTALFVPFTVRSLYLVRKFWWANGAAVAGNVDCGVYSMGGARLLSTGAIAQSGTSVLQSAVPTAGPPWQLLPGSYYMAISASSATATFLTSTGFSVRELQFLGCAQQATANPLPDPATLATISSFTTFPLFGMSDAPVI